MCVPGGYEGDACSPYIDGNDPMCRYRYGCLDSKCVPWFSVEGGVEVKDSWLCKSMRVSPYTS